MDEAVSLRTSYVQRYAIQCFEARRPHDPSLADTRLYDTLPPERTSIVAR